MVESPSDRDAESLLLHKGEIFPGLTPMMINLHANIIHADKAPTTRQRTCLLVQHFHGDSGVIAATDRDKYLEYYLAHQEHILSLMEAIFQRAKQTNSLHRIKFVIESLDTPWQKIADSDILRAIVATDQGCKGKKAYNIASQLMQNAHSKARNTGELEMLIMQLMASNRFIARRYLENTHHVLLPGRSATNNYSSFLQFIEEWKDIDNRNSLSDEEIDAFLQRRDALFQRDFEETHAFIASQANENIPEDGYLVVLFGAGHIRGGTLGASTPMALDDSFATWRRISLEPKYTAKVIQEGLKHELYIHMATKDEIRRLFVKRSD